MSSLKLLIDSESRAVANYLSTIQRLPDITKKNLLAKLSLPTQERKIICFVTELLRMFGPRYADHIQANIKDSFLQKRFYQIRCAFTEIQQNGAKGLCHYSAETFPYTANLLKAVLPTDVSEEEYFQGLKNYSYVVLPVPQMMLFSPERDLTTLERIDQVREKSLGVLLSHLSPPPSLPPTELKEEKGSPIHQRTAELQTEEKVALLGFLNSYGVIYKKEGISIDELLKQWKQFNAQNAHRADLLLKQIPWRSWIPEPSFRKIAEFLKFKEAVTSFRSYLTYCTCEALQQNLQLDFSLCLKSYFRKVMGENEGLRLDLNFLTTDLPKFYAMPLPDRPSKSILLSLQLFLFFRREQGVSTPDQQRALLEMLVHRDPAWKFDESAWLAFSSRSWQNDCRQQTTKEWTEAFNGLEKLLKLVKKQDIKDSLYADTKCWSLFSFLWLNPHKRETFINFFSALTTDPDFSFTIGRIYEFCKLNAHLSSEGTGVLARDYKAILQVAKEKRCQLPNPERLFLVPPVFLGAQEILDIGNGRLRTQKFIEGMQPYGFPLNEAYLALLRRFIFGEIKEFIFTLLPVAAEIGIENPKDPNFLSEILCAPYEVWAEKENRETAAQLRSRAKEMVKKLQSEYQFSDEQRFDLYVEILRLLNETRENDLTSISQLILDLGQFCPVLPKDAVYFLFRYHPKIDKEKINKLYTLRKELGGNAEQLYRPSLDQKIYQEIVAASQEAAKSLANICSHTHINFLETCPHAHRQEMFIQSCSQSMQAAFFPPLQPLTDYFRLRNIKPEGIVWLAEAFTTHLGQLKFVLGEASLGVYIHWEIAANDSLCLFLSFYDVKTRMAQSTYIPLSVSVKALQEEDKSRQFYGFLYALSQELLDESANHNEVVMRIQQDYDSPIQLGNLTRSQFDEVVKFLSNVKVAYRYLFLSTLTNRRLSGMNLEKPLEMAGHGSIFPGHIRGSLLPESILRLALYSVTAFIPDATENFISSCFQSKIFQISSDLSSRPEPLNLNLKVISKQSQLIELPIAYLLQSADHLRGEASQNRDSRAVSAQQEQGSYVTFSVKCEQQEYKITLRYPSEVLSNPRLFQRYFDYHNLLLKAAYYRAQFPSSQGIWEKSSGQLRQPVEEKKED